MATCAICKKNLNVPVWGAAVCAECNLAGEKLPRLPIMLKTFLEEHGIDKSTRRIYTVTTPLFISLDGKPEQIKTIKLFRDWNSATYRQYKIVTLDNSVTFVMSSEYVYFSK